MGYWLWEDGSIIAFGDLAISVPPVMFRVRTFKIAVEVNDMGRRQAISIIEPQGIDESIPYSCYFPTGTNPSSVSMSVWDILPDGTYTDVTATTMPTGSVSVVGDVVTLPVLTALTLGHSYRIIIAYIAGGIPALSVYLDVTAEK